MWRCESRGWGGLREHRGAARNPGSGTAGAGEDYEGNLNLDLLQDEQEFAKEEEEEECSGGSEGVCQKLAGRACAGSGGRRELLLEVELSMRTHYKGPCKLH